MHGRERTARRKRRPWRCSLAACRRRIGRSRPAPSSCAGGHVRGVGNGYVGLACRSRSDGKLRSGAPFGEQLGDLLRRSDGRGGFQDDHVAPLQMRGDGARGREDMVERTGLLSSDSGLAPRSGNVGGLGLSRAVRAPGSQPPFALRLEVRFRRYDIAALTVSQRRPGLTHPRLSP